MPFLSRNRRPRRSGEWTAENAVTFIVTLAATQSVTLAARRAGMSRKSAYALRVRDPAFAFAWAAAIRGSQDPAPNLPKSNEVDEMEEVPVSRLHGNASPSRRDREGAFAGLVAALRAGTPGAPPLAR